MYRFALFRVPFRRELQTPTCDKRLQFSHYVIFFVAIFTVAQLVLLGASTYPIKNAWDIAAYNSKDDVSLGRLSTNESVV